MESNTPLSLLSRIRDETDSSAWRQFDSLYRPILSRYARLCGLAAGDIEDTVQACMASIHQNIDRFVHDGDAGRFRAWLRTMVTNRVRHTLARRREQAAESGDLERPQVRELPPDEAFDKIWWNEHLQFYLGEIRREIDETAYEAFERHVVRQETAETVCRDLDLTAAQLYKIKWRITQKLRDRMGRMNDAS